jgi:ribonuclease HI
VVDAFVELYELEDMVVLDAGKYGFVKLQDYTNRNGFDNVVTYTDSKLLFDDLWHTWLDAKMYLIAKDSTVIEKVYTEVYNRLVQEQKDEVMAKKDEFAKKAGIE